MRHRTGSHRQRPALARRLPLYVLVLGLQVSIGASLMSGGSPAPRTVDAAAHELVTSPATAAPVRRPSIAAPRAPRAAQPAPRASVRRWPQTPTALRIDDPPRQVAAAAVPARLTGAVHPPSPVRRPAVRKPAARKPAARKPAARKPAARKPAARKPAARKPAVRTAAAVAHAARSAAARRLAARRLAARRLAARRLAARRLALRRARARRPAVKKPPKRVAKRPAARKPARPKAARKKPARAAAKKRAVLHQTRWLPTGTGMWTNNWARTSDGNPLRVVRTALRQKVTHIFVKTGTLRGGFDGGPVLARLLPATRGTNVKIVAWDFPMLRDPLADAARLAAAARFSAGPGMPRVAAVAPDIETRAEGTRMTTGAVVVYYRELRRLLPADVAILATVPWPSEKRVGKYPYAVTAQYADAFIPMAYWFNRSPIAVTQQSIRYLERFGRPVMPAGMAYDPALDAPGGGLSVPSAADLAAFASASRRAGATSVSFWAWQTATADLWRGIHAAALGFPKAPAGPPAVPARADVIVDVPVANDLWGGPFDRPS